MLSNYSYIGRFIVVGIIGFVFNYMILTAVIDYLKLERIVAEIIAMIFALQITFFLHDRWTYSSSHKHGVEYSWGLKKRYMTYLLSNSFGSLLTIVLFGVFAQYLPKLSALACAALISMSWNFILNKVVVWRKPKDIISAK